MKSPYDLALRWSRQWENPQLRETRLLDEGSWPCRLSIGRPDPGIVAAQWNTVVEHIKVWRGVRVGTVLWEAISYRATGEAVEIPIAWEISSPDEWIAAASDRKVRGEYESLLPFLAATDLVFHVALIRERSLWKDKPLEQVVTAIRLAQQLQPGCADGRPLRALSLAGIDSKFFERHRSLLVRLLDLRYDGECSRQGLEVFLDAWQDQDHWLLLVRLGGEGTGSLPFPRMRVRASDLATADLDISRLLVVENERCFHLLPRDLTDTIAIFGSGNNLAWLAAPWVQNADVAYWGDIDTWGVTLLARAREHVPTLTPLLMTREVFDHHLTSAVSEIVPAGECPPISLTETERELYRFLLTCDQGRLEQEFISPEIVFPVIRNWAGRSISATLNRSADGMEEI